jgi:hypothetical protein
MLIEHAPIINIFTATKFGTLETYKYNEIVDVPAGILKKFSNTILERHL